MEVYSITNLDELKDLYFHDDELQNIVVNDMKKEIRFHLIKTGSEIGIANVRIRMLIAMWIGVLKMVRRFLDIYVEINRELIQQTVQVR